MMDFLKSLFESGEVTVPRSVTDDSESVQRLLIVTERIWRESWPGTAPAFNVNVAHQAADVLLLLCQSVVYRELDEGQVAAQLQQVGLHPDDSPSTHYSADMLLRFLPQIAERLQRTSSNDPVFALLRDIAKAWPLSAVGIAECVPEILPTAFGDPSLFRVYVDRIIAASDAARLSVPGVANAVEAALGPFENLRQASGLAGGLNELKASQ